MPIGEVVWRFEAGLSLVLTTWADGSLTCRICVCA